MTSRSPTKVLYCRMRSWMVLHSSDSSSIRSSTKRAASSSIVAALMRSRREGCRRCCSSRGSPEGEVVPGSVVSGLSVGAGPARCLFLGGAIVERKRGSQLEGGGFLGCLSYPNSSREVDQTVFASACVEASEL